MASFSLKKYVPNSFARYCFLRVVKCAWVLDQPTTQFLSNISPMQARNQHTHGCRERESVYQAVYVECAVHFRTESIVWEKNGENDRDHKQWSDCIVQLTN